MWCGNEKVPLKWVPIDAGGHQRIMEGMLCAQGAHVGMDRVLTVGMEGCYWY